MKLLQNVKTTEKKEFTVVEVYLAQTRPHLILRRTQNDNFSEFCVFRIFEGLLAH